MKLAKQKMPTIFDMFDIRQKRLGERYDDRLATCIKEFEMSLQKIGSRTTFGLVIFVAEGDNMVSNWEDYIFLNKRKDGKFSVKAYKWGESFRTPNRFVWTPIDSVLRVSSAADLIAAIGRAEGALDVSVDWPDVIDVVRSVDVNMAKMLEQKKN
jgi:hypothetical protein